MIGWNFPSNGGGLIRGIAEAGIQTFTGKEISALAREVCQNSLDAAANENSAVTVEFCRYEIESKKIPGGSDYKNILIKCYDFWKDNIKAKNFLDKAIGQLNLPKTFVLRISDFNTTGLAKPFDPDAREGWNTLTKIEGGATKTGDSAGSYGIGKNAPFANSFYRLVFYRTLNQQDEHAAQGMSRLVSFKLNTNDISGGVGYFGETNKNLPVKKIAELENIYRRDKIGTDIFIYGFNGDELWQRNIFVELVENFLVAIHRGKLRINLSGMEIDKNKLGALILKHEKNFRKANDYYKILSGSDGVKFFERDFHGMGKLKLGVLFAEKLNRRILIVRKNGMKLFDLDKFPRSISFTGILELEGRELNEFFREMEEPTHDRWEPGRYEKNPKLAEKYVDELKRWVRETVSNVGAEKFEDEVNVEGLSHMLDFDDSEISGNSQTTEETFDDLAQTRNFLQELLPTVTEEKNITATAGGNDNSKTQKSKGKVTDNGGNPAIRSLKGSRKRKTRTSHTGEKNFEGNDTILEPVGKKVECNKIRVIKVGEKDYRLILKVPQKISSGQIEIFAIGEDNNRVKLFVTSAASVDSNSDVRAAIDKISFKNLRAGRNAKINFELQDRQNYALGVAVYENQR